ncbi:hypothetical protein EKS21_09060 [Streptococcus mutans]|nr:hypothetical protein [Streptococcus mutans]
MRIYFLHPKIKIKTEKKREKLLTKGGRAGRIKKLSQKEAEPFEN